MKRYGQAKEALPSPARVVPDSVLIPRELLTRLTDRLQARTPAPTILTDPARLDSGQREQNETIYADRSLVDQARDRLKA